MSGVVVLMCMIILLMGSTHAQNFSVVSYGAVGDGVTDDTKVRILFTQISFIIIKIIQLI